MAAPQHHELVIENARVRVLRVCIAPGTDCAGSHSSLGKRCLHTERRRFVRRDREGKVVFDTRTAPLPSIAPAVTWVEPLPPHSVENVGTREIRWLTIELKDEAMSISAL
jgi:hypothetical protein